MSDATTWRLLPAMAVFEAAGRLGSFTRAGRELGISQESVSYAIRKLEQHQLPRSNDISFSTGWQSSHMDSASLAAVAQRWQLQERLTTPPNPATETTVGKAHTGDDPPF